MTRQSSAVLVFVLTLAAWCCTGDVRAADGAKAGEVSAAQIGAGGNVLLVTFGDEELTAADAEQVGGFTLTVNGAARPLGAARRGTPHSIQVAVTGGVNVDDKVLLAYDGKGGLKTSAGQALGAFTGVVVDNRSAQSTPVGKKGIGVMSTRGFARTSALDKSVGKEAITAYRFELPYGLSAGWKLPYLGFSEMAADAPGSNIQIKQVVVTIEQPDQPLVRIGVTFAGQPDAIVGAGKVVESDAIDIPVLPGTVLTVSTFFRNQDPKGSLPFMIWGFTDRMDGCLVDDIGKLDAAALWKDSVYRGESPPLPMWAGVESLIRSYQPMFITGKPHPSFSGREVAIAFLGDSINIAQNDFGRTDPKDPFPARGWNGRYCGTSKPYVVFGQGGSGHGGVLAASGSPMFNYIFGTGQNDRKVTHIVDAYGINTLRGMGTKFPDPATAAEGRANAMWATRQQIAELAKKLDIPYIQTTLTPLSNPDWASDEYGPKDDPAKKLAAFAAARAMFNEKVRHESESIPGCVGFIDWGTHIESDPKTNSNAWEPKSGDGIHPDKVGHRSMSEAVGNPFKDHPLPSN